jgi:two-component sensor histidine kinase
MRPILHPLFLLLPFCLILNNLSAEAQANRVASFDSLKQALHQAIPEADRVKVLIQLGTYLLQKPGESPIDLNEALLLTQHAAFLSKKLNYIRGQGSSYILFSQIYREKGLPKIGEKYINKAIEFLRLHQAIEELGFAYLEMKQYYSAFSSKEELLKRIKLAEKAFAAFQQSGNQLKQANTLEELADLHALADNLTLSLSELKQALAIYQATGYRSLQAVYDLLGVVSSQLGDYKEGLHYGLLAIDTAEKLGDTTTMVCTIYNRVGSTYFFLKNYEQCNRYYRKGISVAIKLNDRQAIFILAHNLSNGLQRQERPLEALALIKKIAKNYSPTNLNDQLFLTSNFVKIYVHLKQYKQAKPYFDQLLQLEKMPGSDNIDQVTFYNTVTSYLFYTHQYNQARKYLMKHQAMVAQSHVLKEAATVQKMWFRLDSAQGNYTSAIRHYQQYKMFEDSLLGEVKSRQIANLEIQYATSKKDQALKLRQKDIILLRAETKAQQTQRNALIGGTLLLTALLGLSFNRYRLKQRSNQQLQVQQHKLEIQHQELQLRQEDINHKNSTLKLLLTEKEWLLKEIHHRVKNNLQIVMSLLNSQASYLADNTALSAIQESQHRVQAMALIHQKLYQSEHVARIHMPSYIEEVVAYLRDAYDLSQPVNFRLAISPIELDVTQAVPLGLIINEAITNSLKYAFPGGRCGTISLVFHRQTPTTVELKIEDDGIGLPPDYDPSRSRSLGMTLIQGFSQQLGGELLIHSASGLTISLQFKDEQLDLSENRLGISQSDSELNTV